MDTFREFLETQEDDDDYLRPINPPEEEPEFQLVQEPEETEFEVLPPEEGEEEYAAAPRPAADYYDRYTSGYEKDPMDPHRSRRITRQQRAEIQDLASQGMNAQDIAFHVDVPVWIIQGILNRGKMGGTVDPNLSISNMQRASAEERQMRDRARWDQPIDIDANRRQAHEIDRHFMDELRDSLIAKYYLGQEEYDRMLDQYGSINNKEFQNELRQVIMVNIRSFRSIKPEHLRSRIDQILRQNAQKFGNPQVRNKVQRLLRFPRMPFQQLWKGIVDTLTRQPPVNPGVGLNIRAGRSGSELKNVKNPYR